MASYSLELWEMIDNPLTPLFDFNYDFYCDDDEIKKKFEEKFINHYYYHEMGCETHRRWTQMLKSRLNLIMPYYHQLYITELRTKDIDFMLNKDLREELIRTVDGVRESDTTTKGTGTSSDQSTANGKISSITDGVASANLKDGYLTGVNQNTSINTTNSQTNTTNQNTETDKQTEKSIFTSQGNIGVTSSAELLMKWREVIINIDKMIIDDCRDLFMLVY